MARHPDTPVGHARELRDADDRYLAGLGHRMSWTTGHGVRWLKGEADWKGRCESCGGIARVAWLGDGVGYPGLRGRHGEEVPLRRAPMPERPGSVNIDQARRPIAVVDERTYRQVSRALDLLTDSGEDSDLVKALAVCHATTGWLRYEIHTGRKPRPVERAARLEQWELTMAGLRVSSGLAS